MEQQQRQQEQQNQKRGARDQASDALSAAEYAFAQQAQQAQPAPANNQGNPHTFGSGGVQYDPPAPSAYQSLHFADLVFEDEDEDDPDFNPDLNPDLPLPSAWSLAVRDVVASEQSRAAAAAVAASHSHSGTPSGAQTPADAIRPDTYIGANMHQPSQSRGTSASDSEAAAAPAPPPKRPADTESSAPRKRGRKPVLEPGEAQRRRAQRNIEYQRMRRQVKKAEDSEQSEAVLELRAEVKMLRAEVERLRDENATLRAQREFERLQRQRQG